MRDAGGILLVDDDDTARYATARLLERGGYAVREAASGREALGLVRRLPQAVVLDVRLPDIDGFEVARRMKRDPASAAIPVVHLTAYYRQTSDAEEQSAASGAEAILFQPVEYPRLIECVSRVISSRAHVDGAATRSAPPAAPAEGPLVGPLPLLAAFLEARRGCSFCTSCLARHLDVSLRAAREAAWTLEQTTGYRLATAECVECLRRRRVIEAKTEAPVVGVYGPSGRASDITVAGAGPSAFGERARAAEWQSRRMREGSWTIELLSYRLRTGWRPFVIIRHATGVFVPNASTLLADVYATLAEADDRALAAARGWIAAPRFQ